MSEEAKSREAKSGEAEAGAAAADGAGVVIRPVEAGDAAGWRALFQGYAAFYRVPMTEEILDTTWSWLMDPAASHVGFVAVEPGGRLIGLAHVRPFAKTLIGRPAGYLDDLFVLPEIRGGGVGRRLIETVAAHGRAAGWAQIRWITADDNYVARTLYDRVAKRTMWITYDLPLDG